MASDARQRRGGGRSFLWPARRTVRFAWRHLRAPLVAMIVMDAVRALLPAVQVVLVQQLTGAIAASDPHRIVPLVVATAAAVGLTAALTDVESTMWRVIQIATRTHMSSVLVDRMAGLSPSRIADPEWAARSQEARESIQQHGSYHLNAIIGSLAGIVSAAGLVAALWSTSPPAALLILASLLPVLAGFLIISHVESRQFSHRTRLERTARYLQDQLTYQRPAAELIALGSSRRVARWYAEQMADIRAVHGDIARRQTTIMLIGGLLTTAALGAALYLVSLGPSATIGGAAGGVVAVLAAAAVVRNMGYSLGAILTGSAPVALFFDFLDATATTGAADCPLPAPADVHELTVQQVGYRYPGADQPTITGIDLLAHRGELIALVGANGAGKTTLVNLIRGSLTPTEGAVLLDGQPLATLSAAERLATFSLLTQEFGRYELTVRDTVLLGSPDERVTDDHIWAALHQARAADFVRRLPHGLDTILGQQWGGVGLSGGQWQRLALARITLRNAPIWLLDEPTSAMDAETERDIFDELGQHRGDRITIVVTHRASTLRAMDRIYVLDEGRIVQTGSYHHLATTPGRFHTMFNQQTEHTSTTAEPAPRNETARPPA